MSKWVPCKAEGRDHEESDFILIASWMNGEMTKAESRCRWCDKTAKEILK